MEKKDGLQFNEQFGLEIASLGLFGAMLTGAAALGSCELFFVAMAASCLFVYKAQLSKSSKTSCPAPSALSKAQALSLPGSKQNTSIKVFEMPSAPHLIRELRKEGYPVILAKSENPRASGDTVRIGPEADPREVVRILQVVFTHEPSIRFIKLFSKRSEGLDQLKSRVSIGGKAGKNEIRHLHSWTLEEILRIDPTLSKEDFYAMLRQR